MKRSSSWLLIAPAVVLTAALAAAAEAAPPDVPSVATFSILGFDPETGEVGGAVQSRVFSVGNGVLWAEAGVGAVATQAVVDVSYGPQALELLRQGLAPEEVVRKVLAADPDPHPESWSKEGRQFAVMNARGEYAAHTGPEASAWAGHRGGRHVTAQGNILAGEAVVADMVAAFESTEGHLSLRLLAALEAGQKAGGDSRGMQSAAMLIVQEDGGPWLHNDVVLRLQVDDNPEPIRELRRLVEKNVRWLERARLTDGEELKPVDRRLLGTWSQIDAEGEPKIVEITSDHWSVAVDGALKYRAPVIGQHGDELVVSLFCNRQPHDVHLEEDHLTVRTTPVKTKFRPAPEETVERYARLDERPEAFDLQPLPLGDPERPLADERRDSIRRELEERGERDQEVRKIFAQPGVSPTPEDSQRMAEVDRDNTAYLRRLLAEVGWIDAVRFGAEAARAAWLTVQHSGDLRLMATILPEIERLVRAGAEDGGRYALLYDRSQISLGRKQRYGSQIFFGPDGMFLAPLEDPENVDARRAELGMSPLADYLEGFRERNDGREVPIRHEY